MANNKNITDRDNDTLLKSKNKVNRPPLYKVVMLNDDYTPMEFVVEILQNLFFKTHDEAITIMLQIHEKGAGVCGVYPFEVAETKTMLVMDLARQEQHPLQCVCQKVD